MEAKTSEIVLGYDVVNSDPDSFVRSVFGSLEKSVVCRCLACINPHSYAVAVNNCEYSLALKNSDWLIPDGIGIVLASRILGGRVQSRITGSDIFFGLLEKLNECGGFSVFFLGSTKEVLMDIQSKIADDYPNIRVAGTYSPPFKQIYSTEEDDLMVSAINNSGADVLWVGMTAPKQELWIFRNRHRLNVKFAAGIGAVFDFYTGRVKRSHPLFQRLGLEWLPRLLQEPRRLWRRMGVSAPIFLCHVLKARIAR